MSAFAAGPGPIFLISYGVIALAVGEIYHVATHLLAQNKLHILQIDYQTLGLLDNGHGDGALRDRGDQLERLR